MADITIKAAYAAVVEDEGMLFIGFAEGESEDEPYVLFRQDVAGGPVWFEVTDESLGAEDAVEAIRQDEKGLSLSIAPAKAARIGWAKVIDVRLPAGCEGAEEAVAALREMMGPRFA